MKRLRYSLFNVFLRGLGLGGQFLVNVRQFLKKQGLHFHCRWWTRQDVGEGNYGFGAWYPEGQCTGKNWTQKVQVRPGWWDDEGMKGSDELLESGTIGGIPLRGMDPKSPCVLVFQHSFSFLPTLPKFILKKMRRQRWHPFLFEDVNLALASFGLSFDLGTHLQLLYRTSPTLKPWNCWHRDVTRMFSTHEN